MSTEQRLHREQDPRVRRALARARVCAVLLVGPALGVVALRVQQVHLGYRLDALRGERTRVERAIRELEVEVATLRSPGRLEGRARQLGMTSPVVGQVRLAREYVTGGAGVAAARLERVETMVR